MRPRRILRRMVLRALRAWRRGGRINRGVDAWWEAARRDPETQHRRSEAGRMRG